MALSSFISVALTKWFWLLLSLFLRKEDIGGKDFVESNVIYHLTWKFWFCQGFFFLNLHRSFLFFSESVRFLGYMV